MTGGWNSELSNAPFPSKRIKLAVNALRINSSYFSTAPENWGRVEIQSRGEDLLRTAIEIWPSLLPNDQEIEELLSGGVEVASEFHFEAVERIANHLKIPFERLSDCRYKSPDDLHRLVGLCSKSYRQVGDTAHYWFGFKIAQNEFLNFAGTSWLALECGTPQQLLLFRLSEFAPMLPLLNRTEGQHWHISLRRTGEQILMRVPRLDENRDVTSRKL